MSKKINNNKSNSIEKYPTGWIEVDVNDLVKADWNYKDEDFALSEKLKSNIKLNGQIENIIIYLLPTGFYCILNGNHRYDVLKELKYDKVMCYNMGFISESKAKRLAIETNETKFATDNIKLTELMKEIGKEFSIEELTSTMPYTEDEINNLLEFSWENFGSKEIEENSKNDTDLSDKIVSTFKIEIILDNESQQKDLYDEFIERGLQCKLLTL